MPLTTDRSTPSKPLISVCVCTYRRPAQLRQLLDSMAQQVTNSRFDFCVIVVDNDARESARSTVESCVERSNIRIAYGVEPKQNIALARNTSVTMATGDYVAFIDDDEEPSSDWLLMLYEVLIEYGADGVIGPVLPKFAEDAPSWAVNGALFQSPIFRTGEIIAWQAAATNNALVKREVLLKLEGPFRSQFGAGGEDRDLFRRAMADGSIFVWSGRAVCQERVPRERTQVTFQLRRALLRGKMALLGPAGGWRGILKSAIAVPVYAVSLPVCLMMGSHVFVMCLVRSCDHLGKILASCGIDVVGDKYITTPE